MTQTDSNLDSYGHANPARHAAAGLPGSGFILDQYARSLVQLDHFFAAASPLWPEVVQHDGGSFLADGFKASSFGTYPRKARLSRRPP